MKIVAHRGASGLETENTIAAIKKAVELGVDAVEIDVAFTKDGYLVLLHDRSLKRIWRLDRNIWSLTLKEIKRLRSRKGDSIPTLQEALDEVGDTPIIIDIKNEGTADFLAEFMRRPENQKKKWYVSSPNHKELLRLRQLSPKAKIFFTAHISHPVEIVRITQKAGAFGVSMNIWTLNMLAHWWARHAGLQMMVWVYKPSILLESRFSVRAFKFFYRDLWISTNRPDKLKQLIKKR